jgi:hypothetical protein
LGFDYSYLWFGHDAICTEDKIVLISSPMMRVRGEQATGMVQAFDLSGGERVVGMNLNLMNLISTES